MLDFMKRVAVWNSKRYEQKFDKPLFIALLREEHQEWREADTEVKKLDALCDEIYVAFGGAWKANLPLEELNDAMQHATTVLTNLIDCTELWPGYFNSTYIDVYEDSDEYPLAQTIALVVTTCMTEMRGMGLSYDQCMQCLNIVADSNDSKSIEKVAANVKANKSKGPYFTAPEPRLQAVLNERLN